LYDVDNNPCNSHSRGCEEGFGPKYNKGGILVESSLAKIIFLKKLLLFT